MGQRIHDRIVALSRETPFESTSVVVGNVQYPDEVANAVALKLAATLVLERKRTEIQIEEQEKAKRIVQAEGIARAMAIINERLTPVYLQVGALDTGARAPAGTGK